MAVLIPDTSPADLLDRFRGPISSPRLAYPDVLHFDVEDVEGGEWWFSTQEAEWSPSDPAALRGGTIVSADLDKASGRLTIGLSGGSTLRVLPDHEGKDDDIEAWQLFTPDGLVLNYGPGERWELKAADEPLSPRP
jgi:hypothetical protein